ncbi:hypothetical protein SASPL_126961 [Salvia splendens]|uniref:Uncharacterized protein n=1 Tax=Salvia splendens TaxID=180675 RepID=A0A8X8XLS7_SALSN|nr:hypothetical protein SASPL_126961 [Salvia splendens]
MTSLNHSAFLRHGYANPAPLPPPQTADTSADLSEKIELGFGPNGLGILSISDVWSDFLFLCLVINYCVEIFYALRLAGLPEDFKLQLEDPNSRYNFGWSHGKEKLESGKPDTMKGSFNANPLLDVPTNDQSLVQRILYSLNSDCFDDLFLIGILLTVDQIYGLMMYCQLELAFKPLGKLILDVGLLLAHHCDQYKSNELKMHENGSLQQILLRSQCHKGRLLYYFPSHQCTSVVDDGGESMSSWCGWHTDHGSLTGI